MYNDVANNEEENEESSNDIPPWCRNRRKLDEEELNNLHPHLRSKYLAVRVQVCILSREKIERRTDPQTHYGEFIQQYQHICYSSS